MLPNISGDTQSLEPCTIQPVKRPIPVFTFLFLRTRGILTGMINDDQNTRSLIPHDKQTGTHLKVKRR